MPQPKILYICLVFLFSTLLLEAQTVFEKSLGFNGSVTSMINTADGGVAYCGQSLSDSGNIVLARYSSAGTRIWQKEFGTIAVETAHDLTQTADGGFVIVGKHWDNEFGMLAMKVDSLGNIVWTKKLSRSFHDRANSVCATPDGGVVISGESVDQFNVSTAIVVKLSLGGSLDWCRSFTGFIDGGYSIVRRPNGQFAMTGLTNAGQQDNVGIVCFDSANVYWSWSIGSPANDVTSFNHQLVVTADSGLVFTGTTHTIPQNSADILIAKVTAAGSPHWLRTAGTTAPEIGTSVTAVNNGVIVGGYQLSATTGFMDPMLVKMQLNGLLSWSMVYPGTADHPIQAVASLSGGEIIAGSRLDNGATSAEPTLWKLGASGNACKVKTSSGMLSFLSAWFAFPVTAAPSSIFVFPITLNAMSSGQETSVCSCNGSVPVSASIPVPAICYGNTTTLNYSLQPGYSYSIYRNNVYLSTASNGSYTLSQGGYYKVVQQSGCATDTSNTVHLLVNTNPSVSVASSGKTRICSGQSVTLSAVSSLGLSYQWLRNGVNIPFATLPSYTANVTGDYKVLVANTGTGCSKLSPVVNVTVNPLPLALVTASGSTSFCNGDSVLLQANNGSGYTYQWRLNGNPMPGATSVSYMAKSAGTYKVRVRDANGCTQVSSGVVVTIPCRSEPENKEPLEVYPNPVNGRMFVEYPGEMNSPFIILDSQGRTVTNGYLLNGLNEVDLSDLSDGIYFLMIPDGTLTNPIKLFVSKSGY